MVMVDILDHQVFHNPIDLSQIDHHARVHVDGTARVQTVARDIEPLYYRLISEFHEITGVPLVLNTSFNGYGEPMVETPTDAIEAMHSMGLDALAIGDYLVWTKGSTP